MIVLAAYMHLPVAVVSTIRETSVIFAVALGVIVLREKFVWDEFGLVVLVLVGLFILAPI